MNVFEIQSRRRKKKIREDNKRGKLEKVILNLPTTKEDVRTKLRTGAESADEIRQKKTSKDIRKTSRQRQCYIEKVKDKDNTTSKRPRQSQRQSQYDIEKKRSEFEGNQCALVAAWPGVVMGVWVVGSGGFRFFCQ